MADVIIDIDEEKLPLTDITGIAVRRMEDIRRDDGEHIVPIAVGTPGDDDFTCAMIAVTDFEIIMKMQESDRNIGAIADLPSLSEQREHILPRGDLIVTELCIWF